MAGEYARSWTGLELMRARALSDPYRVTYLIERKLGDEGEKYRYPRAVKSIKRLQDASGRAGDQAGFDAYLDDLRIRHKRKTAFIAALDKARLA